MFNSQVSLCSQWVTGFGKEKEGTFKNLGLVEAQCNGIAACAYSLKIFTVLYITSQVEVPKNINTSKSFFATVDILGDFNGDVMCVTP